MTNTITIEGAKESITRWVSELHFSYKGIEHRISLMPNEQARIFEAALGDLDINKIPLLFPDTHSDTQEMSFQPTEADIILANETQKICYEEWLNGPFMYYGKNPKGKTEYDKKREENEALVNMYKELCFNSKNERWNTIIFSFKNKNYSYLSNFYNVAVEYNGLRYRNAEAAYQSMKTLDSAKQKEFVSLLGKDAIRFGKTLRVRSDWEFIKYDVLVDICYAKFSGSYDMTTKLLSTGKAYLLNDTTSWHDNELGNCECGRKCKNIVGENLLGKALMQVRDMMSHPHSL